MSDTAAIPANLSQRTLITPLNARLLQQKSVEAKRSKKLAEEMAKKLPPQLTANSPQAVRIERQMQKLERMMDESTSAKEFAELTAAHTRLFNTWQVLTGTPNPGSRRVKTERMRGIPAEPAEPVTPTQPVVVPPTNPSI